MLRRDAPIEIDLADLTMQPNPAEVKRLFDFLEFRTFEERLAEALGPGAAIVPSAHERQPLVAEVTTAPSRRSRWPR